MKLSELLVSSKSGWASIKARKVLAAGRIDQAIIVNRQINELNAQLQEHQKGNGHSFVSRTVLERAPFPEGITVLRVVLSNVHTTPAHLAEILAEQRQLGSDLAGPPAK